MDAPISYFLITTDKFLFKMDTTSSVFFTRHFFTTILELFKILNLIEIQFTVIIGGDCCDATICYSIEIKTNKLTLNLDNDGGCPHSFFETIGMDIHIDDLNYELIVGLLPEESTWYRRDSVFGGNEVDNEKQFFFDFKTSLESEISHIKQILNDPSRDELDDTYYKERLIFHEDFFEILREKNPIFGDFIHGPLVVLFQSVKSKSLNRFCAEIIFGYICNEKDNKCACDRLHKKICPGDFLHKKTCTGDDF